jgi:hypothetical protein
MTTVSFEKSSTERDRENRELLRERDAARYLNVAPKTLQNLRWKGGGPTYVKFTKLVRYRRCDLDAFIESGVRNSTSERR